LNRAKVELDAFLDSQRDCRGGIVGIQCELGRIDHGIQIAFRCVEAPDKFRSKKNVRLDEGETRILPDSRIAFTDWTKQIIRQRGRIVGMIAYERDGADPGKRSFIYSQTQPPRTQNIRCHLRLRIAMSSVKRLQEEHGVVNIRFIEPKLLDGLNLAGNPFAQLPAFEGSVTLEFDLKLARSAR
jgi:hypothetical protein